MKRLLVDTGPLVAIHDAGDASHARCVEWMAHERGRLVTTWPVVTEAMYMLRSSWRAQSALLALCGSGRVAVADLAGQVGRVRELMEKYHDVPMDFADATLVAVAERERLDTVFTLDGDFEVYRMEGGRSFRVVP